jgi:hypothetical protein
MNNERLGMMMKPILFIDHVRVADSKGNTISPSNWQYGEVLLDSG